MIGGEMTRDDGSRAEGWRRAARRLLGWGILTAAAFCLFPLILSLAGSARTLAALRGSVDGPAWIPVAGRMSLLLAVGSAVFFLSAWSASLGLAMGKVERWVILGHWLVVAAALLPAEPWRIAAWAFVHETEGVVGRLWAWRLAAFLGQAAPYLLLWTGILHILSLEYRSAPPALPRAGAGSARGGGKARAEATEPGQGAGEEAKETTEPATESEDFAGLRRRFLNMTWSLWPVAMVGLLALDIHPRAWSAKPAPVDPGPLGVWLVGAVPHQPYAGPGTLVQEALAGSCAAVCVAAAIGAILVGISVAMRSRRVQRGGQADYPSRDRPRARGATGFLVQYVVLNAGLIVLAVVPAWLVFACLAGMLQGAEPVNAGGVLRAVALAARESRAVATMTLSTLTAFGLGLAGWFLAGPLRRTDSAFEESSQNRGGPVTVLALLTFALAFWPFGFGLVAEFRPAVGTSGLFDMFARLAPTALVLAPLTLMSVQASRQGWFIPMLAASVLVGVASVRAPILNALAGPDTQASLLLSPREAWAHPGMTIPSLGLAALVLLGLSAAISAPAWLAVSLFWPKRPRRGRGGA